MPYETGATVRLTRDVQVTAQAAGLPGPLFLAEGLLGIVTGSAQQEAGGGGAAQAALASFDQQMRGARFDGFTSHVMNDIRQKFIQAGATDTGSGPGARTRYRVRFENGFVLDGLEEGSLARA
ncbi:hypothetical protein [Kitasatospora sp. NPDC001547]|uniref:hypothetical protein n=1 Tax=Kitasatospora sp. NPDC001547 TaxID=3364015 RepID=UPI0036A940BB|nr:hypothetical protein KitaXyl93_72820 [Kitasatospora sp. Xyl93]